MNRLLSPLSLALLLASCSSYTIEDFPYRGQDNRIVGTWMGKKASNNVLTKTYFVFGADGSLDGYQTTYMGGFGSYGESGREPSPTIESLKQKGIRWYSSDNSVFCLIAPDGSVEWYYARFNGDDFEWCDANGQVQVSLTVPY
jgi:hypothetical protein